MRLALDLSVSHLSLVDAIAPDYVEPGEDPDAPPGESPTVLTPPGDTPTDPDTGEPEPGVDPDFVHATRIELTNQKQTAIRTSADPGTWGNAYIATAADGYDYWEVHVANSTPRNSTLAIGVTNTSLPLNGIPGDLPGTVAYWSSGVVRNNGSDTSGFPTFGRGDKIMIARDNDTGRVWFGKNGTWLGSTPTVGGSGHQGTLTGSGPYYPFTALYSTGTSVTFKFASSRFAYSVPDGFYPIGQTPFDFAFIGGVVSSSTTIGVNFGSASPNRYIIVSIAACHSLAELHNVTAVSIGGVAASEMAKYPTGSGTDTDHCSIWIANVPTGASGNVVITTNGFNRFAVCSYRAVGLQSTTPHDSGGGASNLIGAIAIDIPAGGAAVGVGIRLNSTPITMSGLDTDYSGVTSILDSVHGSKESAAGETVNVDISVSTSAASLVAASFR